MADANINATEKVHYETIGRTPNYDTKEALDEIKHMKENPSEYKRYDDTDKMIEELLK